MWPFSFRQTLAESGIFQGMTDYHSHILPGVDDGISTIEEAIKTLKSYEDLGIKEVWLTPHIMEDYPNHTRDLQKRYTDIKKTYGQQSGTCKIILRLSAENMLSSLFVKRFEANDILPIIDGKHILVETSYYNPPFGFEHLLSEITGKGYIPILAHPERYHYMSMHDYKELHDKRIEFQLDYMALAGAYGGEVQAKATLLLKKGYYSIAGSDIHNLDSFEQWIKVPVKKSVVDMLRNLVN
ncbi:MAG: capsular biosynthesis protein [Prevotella sp.]|nr:capsular biosynthesis protein [Prevotella sp.]